MFGSLNLDLTVRVERFPQPGETVGGSELATAPGGKSSNQAVAAALLGSPTRLIGAVGDDANGTFLLDRARSAGVDVSGVRPDPQRATGSAMIVVDAAGENTIIVSPGANGGHRPDSLDPAAFADAGVVCLCLEVPTAAVRAAAEHGRRVGAQVLLNLSPYAEIPAGLLALTDVLLVNATEAALVLERQGVAENWSDTLDAFAARGVERVVVTLGAAGSVVLDAGADEPVTLIDPVEVEVVDTTGCGDAFTGALAHRLAGGSSLIDAARFAAQVSALAATDHGAQSSYQTFARRPGPTRG